MKSAIYVRISTENQQVDSQEHAISLFCSAHPDKTYLRFTDLYQSGKKASRPELNKLLRFIEKKEISEVVVYKLDRLFRSLPDLLNTLAFFKKHGVNFISISENIDLSNPAGVLFMQMLGAFAEFERSIIVGRVKAGLDAAKARGQKLGKESPVPIELQKHALDLKASGLSYTKVSKITGLKIYTIQRILLRKEKINYLSEKRAKVLRESAE